MFRAKPAFRLNNYVLLLITFVTSCSPSKQLYEAILPDNNAPVSWFYKDNGYYLYNTTIDLMKNHFSGITVIKPIAKGNFRVVMMTETGLKIMDLEFFPDSVPRVHYIMEAMDKKIIIRTLTRDISLILMNQLEDKKPLWYSQKSLLPELRIARYTIDRKTYHYFIEPGKSKPVKAHVMKGNKPRIVVEFFGEDQSEADSVKLNHHNIDLSISLHRIKE